MTNTHDKRYLADDLDSTEKTSLLGTGRRQPERAGEAYSSERKRLKSNLSLEDETSSITKGDTSLDDDVLALPTYVRCFDGKIAAGRMPWVVALLLSIVSVVTFMVGEYIGERKEHKASRFPPTKKWNVRSGDTGNVIPIEKAQEAMLDIGGGLSLWYRTWGNREFGIPVLFVHGGPGNSVADYHNMNANFFQADQYYVIEVDQRGTGKSVPSVWMDLSNTRFYEDLTIGLMSRDFETLRLQLGIDRWLVFGGSWGSTLGLDYTLRYPQRCLGAILRGIFLDTRSEFDAIYRKESFKGNDRLLAEFDAFLEPAQREARQSGEEDVDSNDSERIVRLYQRLIRRGDRDAIWRWYVFEVNIMEEDPKERRKYDVIVDKDFHEACSVAFFESRLFLHGLFEEPMNLLGRVKTNSHRIKTAFSESDLSDSVDGYASSDALHYWICQGKRDEICPMRYAQELVGALNEVSIPIEAHFVDGGHQATDPVIANCLQERVEDFSKYLHQQSNQSI